MFEKNYKNPFYHTFLQMIAQIVVHRWIQNFGDSILGQHILHRRSLAPYMMTPFRLPQKWIFNRQRLSYSSLPTEEWTCEHEIVFVQSVGGAQAHWAGALRPELQRDLP